MKQVFEPVKMNHIELKNRLVRSATWEGIAAPDGSIAEKAYAIYEELAKGGVGAIITGFTSVALHDYYFGGMMRLCDDALIPQYKKLTDIIHAEGVPAITQLALGAYYREINGRYIQVEPDDMTNDEIQLVIRQLYPNASPATPATHHTRTNVYSEGVISNDVPIERTDQKRFRPERRPVPSGREAISGYCHDRYHRHSREFLLQPVLLQHRGHTEQR